MAAIRRGEPLIVAEGAPARAFELRAGGPHALGQALADLRPPHAGARALVGGFARHDCVACATQVLAGIGWTASICERTAWPPSLWASPRTSGRGGLVSPAVNDSRVAKAQTPSLAKSLGDLRDLSDEELIRQHDELAVGTGEMTKSVEVGVNYYLQELSRREAARQTQAIAAMTSKMVRLTYVIAALTAVNVLIVALSA